MLDINDILETITMIQDECLDIRTVTMGISLLDCADEDIDKACSKVYDKIVRYAENLVKTADDIQTDYGIPIICLLYTSYIRFYIKKSNTAK